MSFNLTPLQKASESLLKSLNVTEYNTEFHLLPLDQQETLQAGVIHYFKVAFELSWKFIKRWIETNIGREVVDGVSRRELFRIAFEVRLVKDVEQWIEFHYTRNTTSHTYDEEVADNAFEIAVKFYPAVVDLIEKLQNQND